MNSYQETSRFILKSKYQSNMLFAMASVSLLTLVLGISIKMGDAHSDNSVLSNNLIGAGHPEESYVRGGSSTTIGLLNPYKFKHAGFMGFGIKIRVQKEYSDILPEMSSKGDFSRFLRSEGTLPSLDYGGHVGGVPHLNDENDIQLIKQPEETKKVFKSVEVVTRIRPDYPAKARREGIEGIVKVLVHIGKNGEHLPINLLHDGEMVTDKYFVVEENPVGYHFADSFLDVLPKYVFSPYIENSIPKDIYLFISWKYCMGADCYREMMTQVH